MRVVDVSSVVLCDYLLFLNVIEQELSIFLRTPHFVLKVFLDVYCEHNLLFQQDAVRVLRLFKLSVVANESSLHLFYFGDRELYIRVILYLFLKLFEI